MAQSHVEMHHPLNLNEKDSTKPRGHRGLWASSMSTAVSRLSKFIGVGAKRASKGSAAGGGNGDDWMKSASDLRLQQDVNGNDATRHKELRRRRRRTTDGYELSIATSTTKVDKHSSLWKSAPWKQRAQNPSRKGSISTNGKQAYNHERSEHDHYTSHPDQFLSMSRISSRDRSLPPSPLLHGEPWHDVRSDSEGDPGMKSPGSILSSDGTEFGYLKTPPDNNKLSLKIDKRRKAMATMPPLSRFHQSFYSVTDASTHQHESGKAVVEEAAAVEHPPLDYKRIGSDPSFSNPKDMRKPIARRGSLDVLSEKSYPIEDDFSHPNSPRSNIGSPYALRISHSVNHLPNYNTSPALSALSYPSYIEEPKSNRVSRYRHIRKSSPLVATEPPPYPNSMALHDVSTPPTPKTPQSSVLAVIPGSHPIWRMQKQADIPNLNTPNKFMAHDKKMVAIGVEFEKHWPYLNSGQRSQ